MANKKSFWTEKIKQETTRQILLGEILGYMGFILIAVLSGYFMGVASTFMFLLDYMAKNINIHELILR